MSVEKCPKRGSTSLYEWIQIPAKRKINGVRRIFDIDCSDVIASDEVHCSKCGWTNAADIKWLAEQTPIS